MRNRGTSLTCLIYSICESPKPTAHLRMKRLRFPTKIRTLSHLLSPLLLNTTLEQPAKKKNEEDDHCPGGPAVKNPPANAGDTYSITGPERSHILWDN